MRRISITIDLWKFGQKIQDMVLATHFIDNWVLQRRALSFKNVPPPHSGVIVANALSRVQALISRDVFYSYPSNKIRNIFLNHVSVV